MTFKLPAKVVEGHRNISITFRGFAVDGSGSDNVASVLNKDNSKGLPYPKQKTNAAQDIQGWIVDEGLNKVQIFSATGQKISDDQNNEVYGKLTYAAGGNEKFFLTYYVSVGGIETPYSIPANEIIDFVARYNAEHHTIPNDCKEGLIAAQFVANDPRQLGGRPETETLNIITENQIPSLSFIPIPGSVRIFVNLLNLTDAFNISGKDITLKASDILPYDIEVGDRCVVNYETTES